LRNFITHVFSKSTPNQENIPLCSPKTIEISSFFAIFAIHPSDTSKNGQIRRFFLGCTRESA